jgi:hypothetical protein
VAMICPHKVTWRKKVASGVKSIWDGKCYIGWSDTDRPMHHYHHRHPTILHKTILQILFKKMCV